MSDADYIFGRMEARMSDMERRCAIKEKEIQALKEYKIKSEGQITLLIECGKDTTRDLASLHTFKVKAISYITVLGIIGALIVNQVNEVFF